MLRQSWTCSTSRSLGTDRKRSRAGIVPALLATLLVLHMATSAASTCTQTCESSIPYLNTLRRVWQRTMLKMGRDDMSFEEFIRSLITASGRNNRLQKLHTRLLVVTETFQDCMRACEHSHSKRSGTSDDEQAPGRLQRTPNVFPLFHRYENDNEWAGQDGDS